MARIIRVRSTFELTIDLDDPKSVAANKDVVDFLIEQYNETLEEGSEPIKSLNAALVDEAVLHDVIRSALEDDIESIVDTSDLTSENSFDIEVLQ